MIKKDLVINWHFVKKQEVAFTCPQHRKKFALEHPLHCINLKWRMCCIPIYTSVWFIQSAPWCSNTGKKKNISAVFYSKCIINPICIDIVVDHFVIFIVSHVSSALFLIRNGACNNYNAPWISKIITQRCLKLIFFNLNYILVLLLNFMHHYWNYSKALILVNNYIAPSMLTFSIFRLCFNACIRFYCTGAFLCIENRWIFFDEMHPKKMKRSTHPCFLVIMDIY